MAYLKLIYRTWKWCAFPWLCLITRGYQIPWWQLTSLSGSEIDPNSEIRTYSWTMIPLMIGNHDGQLNLPWLHVIPIANGSCTFLEHQPGLVYAVQSMVIVKNGWKIESFSPTGCWSGSEKIHVSSQLWPSYPAIIHHKYIYIYINPIWKLIQFIQIQMSAFGVVPRIGAPPNPISSSFPLCFWDMLEHQIPVDQAFPAQC